MAVKVLDEAIRKLSGAGASMRCADMGKLLESLGFDLKDGNRGGHKLFFHDHIEGFFSGSYNCEHGRNPEIKRPYIKKVLAILRQYEAELTNYLEKTNA